MPLIKCCHFICGLSVTILIFVSSFTPNFRPKELIKAWMGPDRKNRGVFQLSCILSRGSSPGSPNQVLINSRKRKADEGRKQGQSYVSGHVGVYFRHIGNAHTHTKRCFPVFNSLNSSYFKRKMFLFSLQFMYIHIYQHSWKICLESYGLLSATTWGEAYTLLLRTVPSAKTDIQSVLWTRWGCLMFHDNKSSTTPLDRVGLVIFEVLCS